MARLNRTQRKTARIFLQEARRARARPREREALIEAGLVEANLTNPGGGDRDSVGSLQERSHYGSRRRRLNRRAAARRFLGEAKAHRGKKMSSGQLAQAVQRSAFPERYDQRDREAKRIIRNLGGKGGTGGGVGTPGRTVKLGGVDRSDQRKKIVAQYLLSQSNKSADEKDDDPYGLKDSNSLLTTLVALKQAKDTPSRKVRVRGRKGSVPAGKGGKTDIESLLRLAQKMGLTVREHPKYDKVDPVHVKGSLHYRRARRSPGAAGDVSGNPRAMAKFSRVVARRYGRDVEELFYNGPGGRNIKNGKRVPRGFVDGHGSHVHVGDLD